MCTPLKEKFCHKCSATRQVVQKSSGAYRCYFCGANIAIDEDIRQNMTKIRRAKNEKLIIVLAVFLPLLILLGAVFLISFYPKMLKSIELAKKEQQTWEPHASTTTNYTYAFRQVKWGMNLEEIREAEEMQENSKLYSGPINLKLEFDKSYIPLVYSVNMFDSDIYVVYSLSKENEKLSRVTLSVRPPCLGGKDLDECWDGINKLLMSKYGQPGIHNRKETSAYKPYVQKKEKLGLENEEPLYETFLFKNEDGEIIEPNPFGLDQNMAKNRWPHPQQVSWDDTSWESDRRWKNKISSHFSNFSIWEVSDKIIISGISSHSIYDQLIEINYISRPEYDEYMAIPTPAAYDKNMDIDNL